MLYIPVLHVPSCCWSNPLTILPPAAHTWPLSSLLLLMFAIVAGELRVGFPFLQHIHQMEHPLFKFNVGGNSVCNQKDLLGQIRVTDP